MSDLERWLRAAFAAAGADVDDGLLGEDAVSAVLDLARDAAHAVARPAAPLSAFAVGLALGAGGGADLARLREVAARVAAAATQFGPV